jgi:predicted Zn finger-like uncharacterized protein
MILTCPHCATRYQVDPAKLGVDGRVVRCGTCRHSWHQSPSAGEDRRFVPIPKAIEPRPALQASRPPDGPLREGTRAGGGLGWLLLLVALVASMAAGYVERERVVELWPPALKLYRLAGLMPAPAGEGLLVRNVTTRRSLENGVQILTVEGEVVNQSQDARSVPPLVATLSDSQHRDVQHWSFLLGEPKLLPGEHVPFASHVASPSTDATDLTIAFGAVAK